MSFSSKTFIYLFLISIIFLFVGIYVSPSNSFNYSNKVIVNKKIKKNTATSTSDIKITHLSTPKIVKGIYITKNTFASKKRMDNIISLATNTHINSMVIDVQSDGGNLFIINKQIAKKRLEYIHKNGIYLIARIVTLNNEADKKWYNPMSDNRRKELVKISKEAIDDGFDEINFDYIRYPGAGEPKTGVSIQYKTDNITSLFEFLNKNVRDKLKHPISIDVFGSTFVYKEKNIGQSMEDASKYFDYIMPMPYPSHWANGSFGYKTPGEHPYEVVLKDLQIGWKKVRNNPNRIAKLRIWIQDFNLKSISPLSYLEYTPNDVHKQIYACYESGCVGWVLWNPQNNYTEDVLNVPLDKKLLIKSNLSSTHSTNTKVLNLNNK